MNSTHALQGTAGFPTLAGRLGEAPPTYPDRPRGSQPRPVRVGPVEGDRHLIRDRADRAVVQLLIDCSGSEYASNGDPTGIRMACGRSLLRLMRTTGGGRMGVIHWGSRPRLTLPLTSVTTGFRTVDDTLRDDPGNMGGNDFPAALTAASQMLVAAPADAIPLVLGITDGLEDITPAMAAAVDALPPGSVHVLLVPGHACSEELAEQWQTLPLGGLTRLPTDNAALAHSVGAIYAAAVGGSIPADRHHVPRPFRRWSR